MTEETNIEVTELDEPVPEIDPLVDARYNELAIKVAKGYIITLDEFKTIVVPWIRQHREQQFVLHKPKAKPVRIPKPKKLTKKAIKEKLQDILYRLNFGEDVSEEDKEFFTAHIDQVKL